MSEKVTLSGQLGSEAPSCSTEDDEPSSLHGGESSQPMLLELQKLKTSTMPADMGAWTLLASPILCETVFLPLCDMRTSAESVEDDDDAATASTGVETEVADALRGGKRTLSSPRFEDDDDVDDEKLKEATKGLVVSIE